MIDCEPKFDDARMPSQSEQRSLTRLIYVALCEMRALSLERRSEQARDLADAFHNVPLLMHTDKFSFSAMWRSIARYRNKYPSNYSIDYLEEWKKTQS